MNLRETIHQAAAALALRTAPTAPRSLAAVIDAAVEHGALSRSDAEKWHKQIKDTTASMNPTPTPTPEDATLAYQRLLRLLSHR